MEFGKLLFTPASKAMDLVAQPVQAALQKLDARDIWVSKIDPDLADTATFCEHYGIGKEVSANCVIVQARRADKTWYAACIILATTRADVNNTIRRALDARKISFASMEAATSLSGMEYGGITPIGLPTDWPLFIDSQVMEQTRVVIGSGMRSSKILTTPQLLAKLPNAQVMSITKD